MAINILPMKTFKEWIRIKEQMHMGRPHGPMGPDGKIYGWSSGPVSKVQGTNTWKSDDRQLPKKATPKKSKP